VEKIALAVFGDGADGEVVPAIFEFLHPLATEETERGDAVGVPDLFPGSPGNDGNAAPADDEFDPFRQALLLARRNQIGVIKLLGGSQKMVGFLKKETGRPGRGL